MFEIRRMPRGNITRMAEYGVYYKDPHHGDRQICAIESGIAHCCKVSTLYRFDMYGWFNSPENVNALMTFLRDNSGLGDWGLKEVLIFSAPETESMTTALLEHKDVTKAWEFPRYVCEEAAGSNRNSIIVYSLRIS